VTGATGLVGSYLLTHLLERGGWDIVTVSRREPDVKGDYRHISVDLLDRADCERKLVSLTSVSHIFYELVQGMTGGWVAEAEKLASNRLPPSVN
jgi:nucleoside-diphosphate-sugar epimerase